MTEIMMSDKSFSTGDRVRHAAKPEWGVGVVTKVEILPSNGQASQRLSVRFPNGGNKTLLTSHAELRRVNETDIDRFSEEANNLKVWGKIDEADWLSSVAKRKVEEAMISLPPDVKDPFNSLSMRLNLSLGLYRFDRSGKGLMDWAVAQTGLDDPLTRFTRQELEQKFERWCYERDQHLAKLLQEVRTASQLANDQSLLNNALKQAPPSAVEMVRRLGNAR
jgi:hypothetical protein